MNRVVAAFASAFLITTSALAAVVEYTYDEIGRLVGVYAPSGDAAQYVYDPAGNITAIKRFTSAQLSVVEFTPNAGPIGTVVTIWGTGFSATPSSNTVTFNGTGATTSSATLNKITVAVPAGATTGPITVTVGANNAPSASNFVVIAGGGAPTISGFAPVTGAAGTTVTISGTNFATTPAQNDLNISLTFANVATASASSLTATVPANTGSGKIKVRTASGTALSADDFLVPFGTYTAAAMISSARTTVDGAPATFSVPVADKVGVVMFEGVQGQRLGIGIGPLSFTPVGSSAVVNVLRPDNVPLVLETSSSSNGTTIDLPILPLTGTYSILVQPDSSHTVTGTVTVSTDVLSTAGTPGTVTALSMTRAGQNGRLTFAGTTGQQVAVYLHNIGAALQASTVYLVSPWNLVLGTATSQGASAYLPAKTLTSTGMYTIFVTSNVIGTGSFSIQYGLPDLAVTSFTPGTPYVKQNGRYELPYTATVMNQGTVGIKVGWLDLTFLSTNSTLDSSDVGVASYQYNTDLPSGASYSISASDSVSASTTPGAYTYFLRSGTSGASHDADPFYVESNVANNFASATISIAGPQDLAISNLAIGTISVNANRSYRIPITFTVTNIGAGTAMPSWFDRCFLSTNTALDVSDWNLGYTPHSSSLAASATYNVSMDCTTPVAATPGSYTLFAKADSNDPSMYAGYEILTEGSESNNATSSSIVLPNRIDDLNFDGAADILLRNTSTGSTYAWFLNSDYSYQGGLQLTETAGDWDLVGLGDFNGDGKLDLVWRNSVTGAAYVWFYNGTTFLSDAFLFSVDPIWKVSGFVDFNGDGKTDLILRNKTTGSTWIWYMNGTTFISDAFAFTLDPSWSIAGAADFNLDGKPDIVVHDNVNGPAHVFYMNGAAMTADELLFNIDPGWDLTHVADYNKDGSADLIYRNKTTGVAYVWHLLNRTFLSDALLFSVDPIWQQSAAGEYLQKAMNSSPMPVNRPVPMDAVKPRPDTTSPTRPPAVVRELQPETLRPTTPPERTGPIPPGPLTPVVDCSIQECPSHQAQYEQEKTQ